ncbi:hypothetical protein C1H46_031593 [Malus baccata]|uniref:Uncharacterized protein n=1 Tax=Malus baccata TaxID=106549 RepID=A0A540L8L8_MALBA|nr:hypothetical protein C1H46_031593 [Malus baccata]
MAIPPPAPTSLFPPLLSAFFLPIAKNRNLSRLSIPVKLSLSVSPREAKLKRRASKGVPSRPVSPTAGLHSWFDPFPAGLRPYNSITKTAACWVCCTPSATMRSRVRLKGRAVHDSHHPSKEALKDRRSSIKQKRM